MKRKISSIFLALCLLISCSVGLVACGEGDTNSSTTTPTHTHKMVYHEAIEPTCIKDGNIAYWSCSECGKMYLDENGTQEVTIISIDAPGHTWGEWEESMPATCLDDGKKVRICSVCKAEESSNIPAKGHVWGEYVFDEDAHWQECTCGERTERQVHQWAANGKCSICGCEKKSPIMYSEVYDGSTVIGYTVTGIAEEYESTQLVIPAAYKDLPVVSISANLVNVEHIKELNIPKTIQEIAPSALAGFSSLQKLAIPFVGTSAKIDIDGFNSVIGIIFSSENIAGYNVVRSRNLNGETKTFYIPSSLKEVSIDAEEIPAYSFFRTNFTTINLSKNVKIIGEYAFYLSEIEKLNVEENSELTSIGTNAFATCRELDDVIFPTIDNWFNISFADKNANPLVNGAYLNESANLKIVVPDDITSIGAYAFYSARGITSVTLHSTVTEIGEEAFYGCSNLGTIYNLSDIQINCGEKENGYIGYYATRIFLSTEENLQRVVFGDYVFIKDNGVYYLRHYIGRDSVIRLPETVEGSRYNIDSYAFYGKTTLREVEIPKGVISIGYAAFSGCFNLEKIAIPYVGYTENYEKASEKTVFGYIFGDYENTASLATDQYIGSNKTVTYYIPAKLETVIVTGGTLAYGAMSGLTNVQKVTIADSIIVISERAFYKSTGLKDFVLSNKVTEIGKDAFYGCDNLGEMHEGSKYIPSETNKYYALVNGDISGKEPIIHADTEFIANNAFERHAFYFIEIPDKVKIVGKQAFYTGEDPVLRITLGRSIKSLGAGCLGGGSTTNGSQRYSVELINRSNFSLGTKTYGITGLTTRSVYTISGDFVYSKGNTSILEAYIGSDKTVNIPSSVKTVGHLAFYENDVETVVIPSSVTTIKEYAFNNCSNLSSLTIGSGVKKIERYSVIGAGHKLKVYFKVTSGWKIYKNDMTSTVYATPSSSTLSDPNKAAYAIESGYMAYYWKR